MHNSFRLILFSILVSLFVSGCLAETELIPRRVSLHFNVDGVGGEPGELTAEGDTLRVTQLKYYLNSFILDTESAARLQANVGVIMRFRVQDAGSDVRRFSGNLGYQDFSTFTGMEYFIQPPPDSLTIPDSDLVEDGQRYSIAIRGTLNGSDFLYRSKANLDQILDFENDITIGADAETLRILLMTDIEDLFLDSQTGRILSPVNSADSAQIVTNVEQHLRVEASAERFLPNN